MSCRIDRAWVLYLGAVLPEYASSGLGRAAVEKALQTAKEQGYKLVMTVATSDYSKRIVEKLGFTEVYNAEFADRYDNYLDIPAEITKTHKNGSVLVKEIN